MPEVRPVREGTIHISSLVLALARVPGVHEGVGWWAEHAGPQSSAVLGCTSLCRAGITNSVRITLLCARPCWSPPHKEGALPQSPMLSGVREHRAGLKNKQQTRMLDPIARIPGVTRCFKVSLFLPARPRPVHVCGKATAVTAHICRILRCCCSVLYVCRLT